jgi:ectoine hydroxylase-related dioxygenase (phytanoyl-CoA dioxygenase family)
MIAKQDIAFYREQGYLLVRGVFSEEEVQEMRLAVETIIERAAASQFDKNHVWGGNYLDNEDVKQLVLKGFHDVHYHNSCFTRAAIHPNMVAILKHLIGPNVQLHHSKMLVKPPENGAAFPMHQDYPYFPHAHHTMLAASVHLDDADQSNGCICVFPGSHKKGPLVTEKGRNYLSQAEYPVSSGTPCPAKAGDVLFFNYLTIHGSDPNRSDRTRRNVLFQYRDPLDPMTRNVHIDWGMGLMVCGENADFFRFRNDYRIESTSANR